MRSAVLFLNARSTQMNLKELSETLGLSPTTVSRALNGYPEVSEITRRRVQIAAAEGNYRPNSRAMGLATGRAMSIGHVIPVDSHEVVVSPIFAEFIAGASQIYKRNGYELMLTIADSDDEESIYRSIAAKRAVDGVVVHLPKCNDYRLKLLKEIGLPFVVNGRVSNSEVPYNWIDMNNRSAFQQATQLLIDLGHKDIAFINGDESFNFAWLRRNGYNEALIQNGLTANPDLMFAAELTETYGFETTQALLNSSNPPSAFLVSSYVVALGVRHAINKAGLTMGKDVSVIIHDDELSYFNNGTDIPQFTSTRSSVREAGVLAAEMLLKQIDDPSLFPQNIRLESLLTIGSSTGPFINQRK